MKKIKISDILLVLVLIAIVVVGVFSSRGNIAYAEVEYPLTLSGEAGLHQITYDEYTEHVESGEPFIVIIERAGCTYCIQYMPIVEEVVNEVQIPIYYIDTDTLTSTELSTLSSTNNYLKKNNWGTPTTLFMMGERILDSIGGYVPKEDLLSFLEGKVVMNKTTTESTSE